MTDGALIRGHLTIGVPVHNGEAFLAAMLENLLADELDRVRVVVSDNASTDATVDIALAAAGRDERIMVRRQPHNVGANANFNSLAADCRTEFFKWAAVDDLLEPGLLPAALAAMDDPTVVLAHGTPRLIDGGGDLLAQPVDGYPIAGAASALDRYRDVLRREVWCMPVFGVLRIEALRRTALLRPFYGADKVLLAELALHGRFVQVAPAFRRRCHDEQSTVLDAWAKQRWTRGAVDADPVPAAVRAAVAYVRIAATAPLPPPQRARATAAAVALLARPDKLRKALLPGPYNYFGWTGSSRRHAYDGLDLRTVGDEGDGRNVGNGGDGGERAAAGVAATVPDGSGRR